MHVFYQNNPFFPMPAFEHFNRKAKPLTCPRHHRLLIKDTDSTGIILILRGALKIELTDEEGNLHLLGMVGTGEWLGEGCLVNHPVQVDVTAVEEVKYLYLDKLHTEQWLLRYPSLTRFFLSKVLKRQWNSNHSRLTLAGMQAEERIYEALHQLAYSTHGKPHPYGIEVNISRVDLAKMTGCTRETVGRALQALDQQKRIKSGKGKTHLIYVSDTQLKKLA